MRSGRVGSGTEDMVYCRLTVRAFLHVERALVLLPLSPPPLQRCAGALPFLQPLVHSTDTIASCILQRPFACMYDTGQVINCVYKTAASCLCVTACISLMVVHSLTSLCTECLSVGCRGDCCIVQLDAPLSTGRCVEECQQEGENGREAAGISSDFIQGRQL